MGRREALLAARNGLNLGRGHYDLVDMRMATRLGGAFWLIGIAYVVMVLPISPPARGALGWVGIAACVTVAAASGVWLLKRPEPLGAMHLFAFPLFGIGMAVGYRWLAGPGSPLPQLLFLCCLYASAVHTPRRVLITLAAAGAAALTPAVYEGFTAEFAAMTIGHLSLTWSLAVVVLFWQTKTRHEKRDVKEAKDQADQLARIDPLTGMGNRRALEENLPRYVAAAWRDETPLSVIVADLDGFKGVNDTFGHQAGDEMIRAAARAFTSAIRLPDPTFRWGGDEFVALLRDADLPHAREVAQRISEAVAFACKRPDGRSVGITLGVAQLGEGETGDDLLARADGELLELKAARPTARARLSV